MFSQALNILLQFALFSLVSAAPTFKAQDNALNYGTGGGILGLIVLILDIIVFSKLLPLSPPLLEIG